MKPPCKDLATVNLQSTIGVLEISGCHLGMHSINRATRDFPSEPDLTTKCIVINSSCENLPSPVQKTLEWLEMYFSIYKGDIKLTDPVLTGQHPPICSNLDLKEFSLKVYNTLAANVQFGSRITYGALADLIGHPKAARAVGTALKKNPCSIVIPCHRVVKSGGDVGLYGGSKDCAPLKEWFLNYEHSFLKM